MYFSNGEGYDAATTESIHLYWHVPAMSIRGGDLHRILLGDFNPSQEIPVNVLPNRLEIEKCVNSLRRDVQDDT